jgi:hypothetical protein
MRNFVLVVAVLVPCYCSGQGIRPSQPLVPGPPCHGGTDPIENVSGDIFSVGDCIILTGAAPYTCRNSLIAAGLPVQSTVCDDCQPAMGGSPDYCPYGESIDVVAANLDVERPRYRHATQGENGVSLEFLEEIKCYTKSSCLDSCVESIAIDENNVSTIVYHCQTTWIVEGGYINLCLGQASCSD